MSWLVTISDYDDCERTYNLKAENEEAAKIEAFEYFDMFTSDFCLEYESEKYLPTVRIFESPKYIRVNISSYWKENEIKRDEEYKRYSEEQERRDFERLQKKFAK